MYQANSYLLALYLLSKSTLYGLLDVFMADLQDFPGIIIVFGFAF
jgi:hypothetical protein